MIPMEELKRNLMAVLHGLAEHLRLAVSTPAERFAAEERMAWDQYVAGVLSDPDCGQDDAVLTADYVLAERRKRFEPKEAA